MHPRYCKPLPYSCVTLGSGGFDLTPVTRFTQLSRETTVKPQFVSFVRLPTPTLAWLLKPSQRSDCGREHSTACPTTV